MAKYVISGYLGFDNFGDEAIAKVLTSYLKEKGAERITVLSANPNKTRDLYGVDSEYFLDFIKPILNSDVLISGGGSLLQDITSLKSLVYYLAVIVIALVFNKKVIIFAQGFSHFRTKLGKFLTKFVLKYCDKIYVRDSKSQEILKDMDLDSEIISDPVFALNINKNAEKTGVGIQLRGFHTVTDNFLENLAEEIRLRFGNEKIKLLSLQDSIDMPVIEKFEKILKMKGISTQILKNLTIDEAINEITKLEYLIGMRFHANLVAAKANVKVLGINYDLKVANLANYIHFPIIGLEQKEFGEEFNELMELNVNKYIIPEFNFPEKI